MASIGVEPAVEPNLSAAVYLASGTIAASLDFPQSDLGNAERFAAEHAADARFCNSMGMWLVWTGQRWQNDPVRLQRMAKSTVRNLYHRAADIPNDSERREWMEYALACESSHRMNAMLALARHEEGIPIDESVLDSDPLLFNVVNGTLDLRTGELREHRREDFITKMAPVSYDANAGCPHWLDFLGDVTEGNDGLGGYLQRAIGYTLTGKVNEHAMFFLYGSGANGKTTFLETLRKVFGDYAEVTPFDTLMANHQSGPRNDLVKLRGARLITATESEDGKRLAEAMVKRLTGGDTIAARALYHEFTSFAMGRQDLARYESPANH
jgi:putative DNA primase/helicase